MRRTFAIVSAAAIAGGSTGAAVGVGLDRGRPVVARPTSVVRAGSGKTAAPVSRVRTVDVGNVPG